jgi:N4-gp56 family major capsid protein
MGQIQLYDSATPRIGAVKGAMLKAAMPKEVLAIAGDSHEMKKNMSDTIIFRRWLPYGGSATDAASINKWEVDVNAHLTQEGVTVDADTIIPQDKTVQLKQYSVLYKYTDKAAELYEDDIPGPMKKQTGQRMGLLREMIRYGTLKGCTNKFYAGGTSRSTVDARVSLTGLRLVCQSLEGNRCNVITEVLSPSPNYGTSSVEAGYLVFVHTNMAADIRELEGFTKVADYGSMKPVHPLELGAVDEFRFIRSPELNPIIDSGAAVGATGLKSTGGSNIDVYPMIVVAESAWADVALRGRDSFGVTHLPHNKRDKSDPNGQIGYVGANFWTAAFIQNDGWMAVYEVGATQLAA